MGDDELAEGIRRGTIGFEVLWDQYWSRVYHWLYRLVRNAEDARDLTSCVFARAWQRLDRYDPARASLCTWLYLTTRTVAYAFRRKQRLQTVSLDSLPDGSGPTCPGPDKAHATAEEREMLWRVVDGLPESERAALRAYYRDGLTWSEASRRMGVSVRTAKFHGARGLALMSGRL